MTRASKVHLLSPSSDLPDPLPPTQVACVYVWNSSLAELEPTLWSYDQFVREKAAFWIEKELQEQDQIAKRFQDAVENLSIDNDDYVFGHGMLKHFAFADGYINLNNGRPCLSPVRPILRSF